MRKICTVLILNLLRSSRRPKLIISSVLAGVILLAGFLLFSVSSVAGPNAGDQRANAVSNGTAPSNDATNTAPATDQPAKSVSPSKKDSTNAKQPAPSSSSNSSEDASSQAASGDLKVKDIAVDQPTKVCSNGQPAYTVQSARISVNTSFHGAGTIRWYWETRVDGGESTDTPPISSQVNSQGVSAGSTPIVFQSDNGNLDPLLTAPTSSTYSYSFRLHILAPNEVVSDWISVPVVLDNSCPSSTQQ